MKLQRLFLIFALLLSAIMAAMIADRVRHAWSGVSAAHQGRDAVLLLQNMLLAAEKASRERGPSNALLGAPSAEYPMRKEKLRVARDKTDQAMEDLRERIDRLRMEGTPVHQAYVQAAANLRSGRAAIDATLGRHDPDRIRAAIQQMFAVIEALEPGIRLLSNEVQAIFPVATDAVLGAVVAARLRESAGKLGSHFTVALATGRPIRKEEHDDIQRQRGRIAQLREVLVWRITHLQDKTRINEASDAVQSRYFESAIAFTESIETASLERKPYPVDAAGFAAAYVPDMDAIIELRDALMQQAIADTERGVDAQTNEAVVMVGGSILVVAFLGLGLWGLHIRVVRPLVQSTDMLVAISQGRLDQKIPDSAFRDEISELFRAIRVLRDNTRARFELEKERIDLIEQLRMQSNTDYLTGLPNRRGFYELAEHELPNTQRQGYPLTLAMFDVDHFKKVNDVHGHAVGDMVLIELARLCQSCMRRGDIVARFGGEEFVIWMPYCSLEQGIAKVEALRLSIENTRLSLPQGGELSVTASFGVASWSADHASIDKLISTADEYLYAAKSRGRNRVVSAA